MGRRLQADSEGSAASAGVGYGTPGEQGDLLPADEAVKCVTGLLCAHKDASQEARIERVKAIERRQGGAIEETDFRRP